MRERIAYGQSRGRTLLLIAAGSIAFATPVSFAQLSGAHATVSPLGANTNAKALEFDVVSIKLNKSGDPSGRLSLLGDGDGLIVTNATMQRIIEFAFNFRRDDLVLGAPGWARSERYDVAAKVAGADITAYRSLKDEQRRVMLQAVFADRCKMQAHRETREMPVYALVVAKTGSKMSEAKPGDTYPDAPNGPNGEPIKGPGLFHLGPSQLAGHATSMTELTLALSGQATGRQVVDQSGLKGKYDFMLQWTPDQSSDATTPEPGAPPESATPPESSNPSLFAALQEQLGLRLEPTKGLVDVLVIDHVDRPSDN